MNIFIKMNFLRVASKVNEILYAIDSCANREAQEPLTLGWGEICGKEMFENLRFHIRMGFGL